jgi:uncharacterized protein (TIGR02466 family)
MIVTGWPTHVYLDNIQNDEYILELYQYLITEYSGRDWPTSFSQKNLYTNNDPIFQKAKDYIAQQIDYFAKEVFKVENPQLHTRLFCTNHHTIGMHQHSGSIISGVFYVAVNEQSKSVLRLHDPRTNAVRAYPPDYQSYFEPKVMQPKIGDIIIFPSFLQHEVPFNQNPNEPRIIMPFDVFADYPDQD